MSPDPRQLMGWGRQTLLTVGAVVGSLCLLVAAASALFGVRPLVFESGSMSPTIGTGALAISRDVPATDLRVGDVVSVPTDSGQRVTHRIVTVTHRGDLAALALQGDANEVPDARTYQVSHADRVLFDVSYVGYWIAWLVGPIGLFLLGLYAAFLLSIVFRRETPRPDATLPPESDDTPPPPPAPVGKPARFKGRTREAPNQRSAARTLVSAIAVVAALGVLTGFALPLQATPTIAAWSDPASVSGTSLTAYTVPAPPGPCVEITPGTSSVRGITATWPGNAAPLPLLTYLAPTVTGLASSSKSVTTSGANRVLTVTYNPNTVGNQNRIVTVTDQARLSATAGWKSVVQTWKFRTGGSATAQPICGDAIPPALTFQAPDGARRTVADEKAFISGPSGCTTSAVILCGTIDDTSSFTVTYTLKRVQGATTKCWTGSWSNSQAGGTCTTFQPASSQVVGNLTSWYALGDQATVYAASGAGDYTLTARAVDAWQNITTQSVDFTLD